MWKLWDFLRDDPTPLDHTCRLPPVHSKSEKLVAMVLSSPHPKVAQQLTFTNSPKGKHSFDVDLLGEHQTQN